ncbi:tripartite motif-containing protein 16 [Silurus asotus]|uniref:Tripartite motif-containing protein 16 n=1 Tax=Silurus asotus TaxID=30991 RepID=A0AAD5A0H9_SILAS|nr:tripartite motif-containing protein 16 [Silurus asotus]
MAEASISVDQLSVDHFICPVCLDLLKDPVTVPCGHSFCKVCINDCWDQEDQKSVYSCPQCRDTFTQRPVLRRNNMLVEVVEKLKKKTEVQTASPDHCYAGPGDVECDFCIGRKHKAVKSCLVCVASFCEIHLKPHYISPTFKTHTLTEASAKLQEKICSEHNKLIEIFCRTDQTCICYLCTMDKHKGHDVVTASVKRAEKQSELKKQQMKSQQRIQEKQKKVQELKQAVNTIKLSAQTAVEDSEKIFTELISSMEKRRSEVMEMIRAQEEAELSRAERLLAQLEQEITDLQRRVTELEQLSHTNDHIYFLQALASGRQSPTFAKPNFDTFCIAVRQHLSFDGVRNSLSDLKKRLEEFCEEEFNKIPAQVSQKLITLRVKMAEASISVDQDQFICPVCLDLLKDPVTVSCGHSFCKVCINDCWDQEDQKGVYSCPQCKDTFTPRPVVRRNNMLAEVVEKLKKKTEVQTASPDHCYAGPGDVECDFCTRRKHKAVKSCLMCLVSFCKTHLKPHLEIPALEKHTLIEASAKLQEKICSEHNKLIEIYCRTDQTCICHLCMMENHKGHKTVTAEVERSEKQSEVKEQQIKSQQRIQEKQKKVQELKQAVNTIKLSAQTAVEDTEKIFTEMISSMEKKRSEVKEMIRAQEEAELSRAERLLEELEQEITDLMKRVMKLEQILHTQDHIHFLQIFASGRQSPLQDRPNFHTSNIMFNWNLTFPEVRNSLTILKSKFTELCTEEFGKIRPQDFCYLTLDPKTAYRNLILSEKDRVVRHSQRKLTYSDHPERFVNIAQVLCKESVCGRCYWEVEWSGDGGVFLSVSYKDISRKGQDDECVFGRNSQSWSLYCSPSSLAFYHNNIKTDLRIPSLSRIGVYVDHSAGTLSFYRVSDTKVQTTFTQRLYAGFWVGIKSTVRLCDPE